MQKVDLKLDTPVRWTDLSGRNFGHRFEQRDLDAIAAALGAERPLLVRGEPGVGKTQLAMAAAIVLKRAFVSLVVDARTDVRDLRWTEDLVARLADAQMAGLNESGAAERVGDLDHYTYPGPLWWGFQWDDATKQVEGKPRPVPEAPAKDCTHENGVVVLIDEIDKAEADLPNGLLEALGARQFRVRDGKTIAAGETWPLVVITTNEDRQLPDAFLRRCVVHRVALPKLPDEQTRFLDYFETRGRDRFEALHARHPGIVAEAAAMVMEDRLQAKNSGSHPLPGFAEFIDLLSALDRGAIDAAPDEALARLRPFFLQKHADRQE